MHAGKCGNKYQLGKQVFLFLKCCWVWSVNSYYKKDWDSLWGEHICFINSPGHLNLIQNIQHG